MRAPVLSPHLWGLALAIWTVLAVAVLALLWFVPAPYGRHVRRGWGARLSPHLAWMVMEAPAPLIMLAAFCASPHPANSTSWAFLAMWQAHYLYRAFIYPWRLRGAQPMPVAVVAMGLCFNLVNGLLNGYGLFWAAPAYPTPWLASPRFLIGLSLYLAGAAINRQADRTLRSLRAGGQVTYAIPYGGLFRWISCPNYLGEIIQWFGWAMATWSLAGLAFALWVVANLAPRARAHHRWYRATFPDYPPDRRALLPGLW